MAKFKTGDKVICVRETHIFHLGALKKGEIHIIDKVFERQGTVTVRGNPRAFRENRFEHYIEPVFTDEDCFTI